MRTLSAPFFAAAEGGGTTGTIHVNSFIAPEGRDSAKHLKLDEWSLNFGRSTRIISFGKPPSRAGGSFTSRPVVIPRSSSHHGAICRPPSHANACRRIDWRLPRGRPVAQPWQSPLLWRDAGLCPDRPRHGSFHDHGGGGDCRA